MQYGQPVVPNVPAVRRSSAWPVILALVVCAFVFGGVILISTQHGPRPTVVPDNPSFAAVTQAPVATQPPFVNQPAGATKLPVAKQVSAATQPPVIAQITSSPTPDLPITQQPGSQPAQSVTNGEWIAYSYNPVPHDTQNKRDIYMINLQTRSSKQITFGYNGNNFPAFSPDGGSFVYTGCRANGCFVYERDQNGNETRLTDTQSYRPDWCPVPSKPWVIYENHAGNNISIWMVDLETHEVKQFTQGPGDFSPDWSPDCSQFAFIRDTSPAKDSGDIYIYDLSTGQTRQVTTTPDIDEESISWSPTGEWLAFTQIMDDNGSTVRGDNGDKSDLVVIRPDGTNRTNLTSGSYNAYSPSWSPDGNRIVFSASYSFNQPVNQLIIYSGSDDTFTAITDQGPYFHPAWAP